MSAETQYNINDNGRVFGFMPYRPGVRLSVIVLCIVIILAVLFAVFFKEVGQGWRVLFFVLAPYLFLHSLYDIFIRPRITYLFDRQARMVYRKFPFLQVKELMRFEEVIVFTRSFNRSWFYAIGAKKKYLVTNYRISEDFTQRSEKTSAETDYENAVLKKIAEILEKNG
ncbi:hypothetical protein [uncultured Chryseobacterium sp.]|uniref:hypothetical protein n=1 Tax=uncultured Chryseobacterium sp. TaxID=259322 RepID=UPI0025D40365|nr:hypothetical protein [uncultured Chryseobacterium sp.]